MDEERIDWRFDKFNQFSDELKSENQQILEDEKDETIMSENVYSSDIQYCQTFRTSLLWEGSLEWNHFFFIFEGFGSSL